EAGHIRLPDYLHLGIPWFTSNVAEVLGLKKYIPKIVENVRPQPQSSQRIHFSRNADVRFNPRRTGGSIFVIHPPNMKPLTERLESFPVFAFPGVGCTLQPILVRLLFRIIIQSVDCEHLNKLDRLWKLP